MAEIIDADFFEPEPISPKAAKRQLKKNKKETRQKERTGKGPVAPRNEEQAKYIDSLNDNELTFGIGPAGVGKTYVAARVFGDWLRDGFIDKVYIARPNVAKAKHRNGFLPGSLEEKNAPWLVEIYNALRESMGKAAFTEARQDGSIEEVPFEYIQGRTLKGSGLGAACIIDEAENLDLDDLYITLTRQGEGLTMALCGDIYQARIPNSGLKTVVEMSENYSMQGVGTVEFSAKYVERSEQARQWVEAFQDYWGHGSQQDQGFVPPAFMTGE